MIEKHDGLPGATPAYIRSLVNDPPLILKNFHHEDIKEFLKVGMKKHYQPGQTIMNESSYVKFACLVVSGKVGMSKDNLELLTYPEKTFLGETFIFSKTFRNVRMASLQETTLLIFKRRDTLNFFRKKPEKLFNIFTRNIIEIQQNKMSRMEQQLYNFKRRLG